MTPIFRNNEDFLSTNYRSISRFSYFSKLLEHIFNCSHGRRPENATLFETQKMYVHGLITQGIRPLFSSMKVLLYT